MKKFLIASGVAVLAFATVASAQGYSFNANLTVGSTGADVSALQTWLMANGYSIPSLASGAAAKGYFGSQTKAAVMKYQAAKGLPATGFFGPLTRGALNGAPVAMTPVSTGCPVGFTCTANTGSTTGGPTGITTVGIPGTLIASIWTSPSNGTTVYKGQSYDVVAYKLQSSASDMAVQSISLDFDTRIWLYASAITLKDDQGVVIGQVTGLNSGNFSEITVGSQYRIVIPVSNYVVKATQTRYVTANVTFLPTSDRSTGTLSITNAQVRSVDGTGVSDTQTVASTRTFSYQGSGAGSVVITVDSASPLAGLIQISTGGQTQNVPLAVYDIKAQNAPANLRSLSFTVYTTGNGKTPADLFTQYNLKIGSQTFGANSITTNSTVNGQASSTVTFTNFGSVALAADTYVPVTLLANIQQNTNNTLDGVIASTTLVASGTVGGTTNNPVVEDQSFSALAVNAGTFISSNLTFSGSSAVLSGLTATVGSSISSSVGGVAVTTGYNVSFGFTVTAGNNTLFLSANPAVALSTTSTGFGSTASSSLPLSGVITTPGSLSGDSAVTTAAGYYVVPAGSSRQFTFSGSMNNTNGAQSFKTFSITAVNYGTTTSSLSSGSINYNLQPLKVSATF